MKRWATCLTLGMALTVISPAYAEDSVQKVMDCMRSNVPDTLRVQEIELSTTNMAGDAQKLRGRLFAMREKTGKGAGLLRAMLRIDGPSHMAGVSYLVRETEDYLRDGMFVYLPSVKRVRRVTGTFADGALLGTNFSYYDFKQMANAFGDLVPKLESPEEIDARPTYVLSFTALPGAETRYTNARAWIDQKTCVPLKTEFYEGEVARKRLTSPLTALQQSGKYWYANELEMLDLTDNGKTLLRIGKVVTGKDVPSGYFDPNSFFLRN